MRRRLAYFGVAGVLAASLVAVGVFISGTVLAGHTFSDVPASAFYHNAVEWVFNRGITAGCAPGLYCPDASVTRGQMAVFLQKEGQALTPTYLATSISSGPMDIDTVPVVCQSGDFAVTGYPRQAMMHVEFQWIQSVGDPGNGVRVHMRYSTNGGATWNPTSDLGGTVNFKRTRPFTASWQDIGHISGPLMLAVGTTYRFGVAVTRDPVAPGSADFTESKCDLVVEIHNRNGASSPLRP